MDSSGEEVGAQIKKEIAEFRCGPNVSGDETYPPPKKARVRNTRKPALKRQNAIVAAEEDVCCPTAKDATDKIQEIIQKEVTKTVRRKQSPPKPVTTRRAGVKRKREGSDDEFVQEPFVVKTTPKKQKVITDTERILALEEQLAQQQYIVNQALSQVEARLSKIENLKPIFNPLQNLTYGKF